MSDEVKPFVVALGARAPSQLEAQRVLDVVTQRWPSVALDGARFGSFVAERLPEGDAGLGTLHLDDLALAWACLDGQPAALETFEAMLAPSMKQVCGRNAMDPDELASTVRVKLLVQDGERAPGLTRYAGLGPLKSFVMVVAMRALVDERRKASPVTSTNDDTWLELATTVASDGQSASSHCDWAQLKPHLAAALSEGLAALPVRQRNVLRLHYVEGVSADALGRMYSVHRATTTRWLTDGREQLFAFVQARLRTTLDLGTLTLESVNRDLAYGIELSLPGVFGAAGTASSKP